MPLASPQAQRTLSVALGHRFQGFLGGADDGGQVHDHQRQAAGEQAGLEAQCLGEHQHTHQTVNDTGDARQRLVGELDHRDYLAVLGVLGQVNGRAHTQRQYDQKRQQDDIQRVEDRRQDAVCALQHTGGGGQEFPADVRDAAHQHHAQNARHQYDDQHSRGPDQSVHHAVPGAAGGRSTVIHRAFLPSAPH